MGRKKKYTEVKGWWVYSIKVPSVNKYYIGISKLQCCQRWQKSLYNSNSLAQYLNEWDLMEKTVLIDSLTKEEALKMEDELIIKYTEQGICINKQRSGLITNDEKQYYKQHYENNKEKIQDYNKQRHKQQKQYYEDNKEKIIERQKQYYEDNKEKVQEYYKNNKEKIQEYKRQWYKRKKLQQQNQQLNLFDF